MKNYKVLKCNNKGELDIIYTKANATKEELREYYKNFKDGFKYLVFEQEEDNTIVDVLRSILNNNYNNNDLKYMFFLLRYLGLDFLEIKLTTKDLETKVLKFTCNLEFNFLGLSVSGISNMLVFENNKLILELETL